jgi:hypothetical protein
MYQSLLSPLVTIHYNTIEENAGLAPTAHCCVRNIFAEWVGWWSPTMLAIGQISSSMDQQPLAGVGNWLASAGAAFQHVPLNKDTRWLPVTQILGDESIQ